MKYENVILNYDLSLGRLDKIVEKMVNDRYLEKNIAMNAGFHKDIIGIAERTIKEAFVNHLRDAKLSLHRSLFILYKTWTDDPLSPQSQNQHNPILVSLRNHLESKWIEYEKARLNIKLANEISPHNFINLLNELCDSHPASKHPIFDFISSTANEKQINYFFKSDSALNLLFFDLVALTLVGSFPETRAEISQNLWDEIGKGSNEFTHVNLYKDLLKRQGIDLPDDHFIHLYEWEGIAGYNLFMMAGVIRKHYYKSLGIMAMTEMLDPPQYKKLVDGCLRTGLSSRDVHYYSEHISVDVGHAEGWLNNVIIPITEKNPDALLEIYYGAALRLQTCHDYYDNLLDRMRKI